jgi:hypothetical protein
MNDFFAALYELITSQGTELSKLLYDDNTYVPVGIFMLLLSIIGMVVFYYVINHPKFTRWYHWFLTVGVVCVINFIIAYFNADGVVWDAYESTNGYVNQIIIFAFANVFWTLVFSFIVSLIIKWKSTNAKHSPF